MICRVLVCGGRKFNDGQLFNKTMEEAKKWFDEDYCIINGLATGADSMAHSWAMLAGIPSICVPANWAVYQNKSGPIRNQWMIDFCAPDLVIAFPGGSGTAHMIKISKEAGIPVWQVQHGA